MGYRSLNRGNGRCRILAKSEDFEDCEAFESMLAKGLAQYPCQVLPYQLAGQARTNAVTPLAVAPASAAERDAARP